MEWPSLPDDHPTPSLVVHAPRVRRNLERMQTYCRDHGLRLRPHTKTHKSRIMAGWQLAQGASGLTVAKIGEAECMSDLCSDLFVAYPAVGRQRLERLGQLAKSHRISVGIDSMEALEAIDATAGAHAAKIGVLVDLDVGFHRTGLALASEAIALCQSVAKRSHVELRGVMCFPGHLPVDAPEPMWQEYEASIRDVVEPLERSGIAVETISGGSTPTAVHSHRNRLLNEIRPGTYIYNDWNEVRLGVATPDDCAARVIATVVSMPSPHRWVVDAGSKTLSSDRNAADPDSGFGHVVGYPEAKIVRLSEEHGEITLPESSQLPPPKIGQSLWIIPNHICVCVNLQNQFLLVDDGITQWLPVDARGMLV